MFLPAHIDWVQARIKPGVLLTLKNSTWWADIHYDAQQVINARRGVNIPDDSLVLVIDIAWAWVRSTQKSVRSVRSARDDWKNAASSITPWNLRISSMRQPSLPYGKGTTKCESLTIQAMYENTLVKNVYYSKRDLIRDLNLRASFPASQFLT